MARAASITVTASETPRQRSLSALPDWSAVPSNSAEDRILFNTRLAFFGKSHFLLSAGFLTVSILLTALQTSWAVVKPMLAQPGVIAHAVAFSMAAAQWALCRRGRRSPAALNLIDAGGLVAMIAAYACMPLRLQEKDAAQLLTVLPAAQAVIILRAVVVPATARRTMSLSAAACVPMVAMAYYIAKKVLGADSAGGLTIYFCIWSATIVAIATLASRVIYGLQQRVREAFQVGQYTLEEKIGEGGMGVVYRARHALLRQSTAIKLLPPERAGAQNLQRFEREVQQTSLLTHPNTVAIYDYGHTADGIFYYAMEYLDGVTLEQLVDHDGPQPPGRVIHLLRQVCGSLGEAHAAGLIHRDIKPANILVRVRGGIPDHVTVLDFGLVKDLAPSDNPGLSTAGALIGTPLYTAPEGITQPSEMDPRADLYSVGAVAYFLLTGRPPFEGASLVEVAGKHLHAVPDAPSVRIGRPLPAPLEALILRCLAKAPGSRPASARALDEALAACAEATPWPEADALRWWRDQAPALRAALTAWRRRAPSSASPRTLAVAPHQS